MKAHSENFDLIINILVGIRRSLGSLVEVSGIGLEERLYKQKTTTITDYISKDSKVKDPLYFRFTDYAPFVFQRIRMRRKITEEDYMKSLGPE